MFYFLTILVSVWALAMGAWFLVSKYFKSSDIDRVKARLMGTSRSKATKSKKGLPAEKQVIINQTDTKNQFAQAVVEKYQLGPKLGTLDGTSWVELAAGARGESEHHDIRFGPGNWLAFPADTQVDHGSGGVCGIRTSLGVCDPQAQDAAE